MIRIYQTTYNPNMDEGPHRAEHAAGIILLMHGLEDLGLLPEGSVASGNISLPGTIMQEIHGKPYLTAFPDIHFNISHSNGIAVCAVADHPVGIDIDYVRSFHENVLRKVLTDEELLFLNERTAMGESREEWFIRFWTLKESYVKYLGTGLLTSFRSFSFNFDPFSFNSVSEKQVFFSQTLLDTSSPSRFYLALASEEELPERSISVI